MPPRMLAGRGSSRLEPPSLRRERDFLQASRRSRVLHQGLVAPPITRDQFRAYLRRVRDASHRGYFVCLPSGELAGVINLNEIVRGPFRSAYLGYYALSPHDGQGHMAAGLGLVMAQAFRTQRLHRLEANIQPHNRRSIRLVECAGFRLEGFSPRYLKIDGRWRDHERWAITLEDWLAVRR